MKGGNDKNKTEILVEGNKKMWYSLIKEKSDYWKRNNKWTTTKIWNKNI